VVRAGALVEQGLRLKSKRPIDGSDVDPMLTMGGVEHRAATQVGNDLMRRPGGAVAGLLCMIPTDPIGNIYFDFPVTTASLMYMSKASTVAWRSFL